MYTDTWQDADVDASPESEVRAALHTHDADRFTSHLLLDRVPWLWPSRADYIEWKSALAAGLDVDPYSIVVVGSACTGVTLNPKKQLFSRFKPTSDVDVAVISSYHFEIAWKTLREIGNLEGKVPTSKERQMRKQHREYLVFDGTIATDWILPALPFGEAWRTALLEAGTRLPVEQHTVNARIYRNMQDLRSYHVRNIKRLQKTLTQQESVEITDDEEGVPLSTDSPEPSHDGD